jgi:hypothetical protein
VNVVAVTLLVPLALVPVAQERSPAARAAGDPTSIDAELRRVLTRGDAGPAGAAAAAIAPFPSLAIRALVVPKEGAAIAIVEVDGVRVRVEAGARIAFGAGEHLRVDELRAGRVVLVRESTREVRTLR